MQQDMTTRRKEDEYFMQWLSPSYWLVEAQLYNVRARRGRNTLQWARNMPEFRVWRMSDPNDTASKERILWVRGTLGVGKSIMAGYFIELLQQLHPTSTVAYFFCKSGQSGLTKARDILGTIAYQCMKDRKDARAVLEGLRNKNFQLVDSLGIGFLFQTILLEALDQNTGEIYIVIDGLDEADLNAKDIAERPARPEIEILLECLATLPSTRSLFISRPNANVSRILPLSIIKSIGKNDNYDDIDAYVKETIRASKTLQRQFRQQGVDALQFFREKANSIFLWVVLVLQQLAKAKSTSRFKKYLRGFSDASGDMESLYTSLLSKFEEEESRWVKEILKWLVVARKSLTVQELKEAVEISLDDQLPEFSEFLEVECGSLVHLLQPSREGGAELGEPVEEDNVESNADTTEPAGFFTVQLVHETLRSYLVNPQHCPLGFRVDEELANSEALGVCLRLLSKETYARRFTQYAALNWGEHLTYLNNSKQMSVATLTDIYHFFHSDGCKNWIKLSLVEVMFGLSRFTTQEERFLQNLYQCLVRWYQIDNNANSFGKTPAPALLWAIQIVSVPSKLEEYVGKASAELWLYEKLPPFETTRTFWLAVMYYCKGTGLEVQQLTDLESLAEDQFACIVAWAGDRGGPKRVPETLGLALAYYALHLWGMSIAYLKALTNLDNQPYLRELLHRLGKACLAVGDHDGAMDAFLTLTQRSPPGSISAEWAAYSLGLVYKAKRDWHNAIQAIQKALELGYGCNYASPMYLSLAELYRENGDHEKIIEIFEAAVEIRGEEWWVYQYLAETCNALGDSRRAKAAYEKGSENHPIWAQSCRRGMEIHLPDRSDLNREREFCETG